jgi:hypothetical protein
MKTTAAHGDGDAKHHQEIQRFDDDERFETERPRRSAYMVDLCAWNQVCLQRSEYAVSLSIAIPRIAKSKGSMLPKYFHHDSYEKRAKSRKRTTCTEQ